jgi:hypothetical protein
MLRMVAVLSVLVMGLALVTAVQAGTNTAPSPATLPASPVR